MTYDSHSDQAAKIDYLWSLLHQEIYTPEQAAEVLNLRENLLLKAAFGGDLKAEIVNGDVLGIKRADLVHWMQWREQH